MVNSDLLLLLPDMVPRHPGRVMGWGTAGLQTLGRGRRIAVHAAWFGTSILYPYILTTSILEPYRGCLRHSVLSDPSPAGSDDEVLIPRFSHRPALVSCCGDAAVPPQRLRFLAFAPPLPPPLLLLALNLPCRLAAVADALLNMVNSDLLLLHLLEVSQDANVISSNEMNNRHECLSMARSPARPFVGIVRCIEKLLIACASMSLDSCHSAR
jgi:hypothetical protein